MHWVLFIFGSGWALFIAAALLLIAIIPSIAGSTHQRLRALLALIGGIFLLLSAAPLPLWCYAIISILLCAWLFTLSGTTRPKKQAHLTLALASFTVVVALVGNELRYQNPPPLQPVHGRRLYLFGDSIAAGIGSHNDECWPDLMCRAHRVELFNSASPGDTIEKATEKARSRPLQDGLVLLEIGGNDLLNGTDIADFERDLNDLLTEVCGTGRQVVMFELPLPPFHNGYGMAQRRVAAQHDAYLIPKRVLMRVLAAEGATIDSLHLSRTGHQQLAVAVWEQLQPAFRQ
jgi:acyl-CoA thioesterase-1